MYGFGTTYVDIKKGQKPVTREWDVFLPSGGGRGGGVFGLNFERALCLVWG